MMKERLEEIACVVVPAERFVTEWLKCKNRGNDSKFLVND